MEKMIINEAKKFLIEYCTGKECDAEVLHPWRVDGQFAVLHSLRVEKYVEKILAIDKHNLSQDEIVLTRLLALLHDVGRVIQREEHSKFSARIVKGWLDKNPEFKNQICDSKKLIYMIENHSDKDNDEADFGFAVFKDADELDEIGVHSVFMASNRIEKESPYFFNFLEDRVSDYEIEFCNKKMKKLYTDGAKKILKKKKEFIELLVAQLKDENDGTKELFEGVNYKDNNYHL